MILYLFNDWHTHKQRDLFRTFELGKLAGENAAHRRDSCVAATHAHHDQVRLVHVFQEVAGVGSNWTCPRTPQQGEQPTLINHPQVDCDARIPQSSVWSMILRLKSRLTFYSTDMMNSSVEAYERPTDSLCCSVGTSFVLPWKNLGFWPWPKNTPVPFFLFRFVLCWCFCINMPQTYYYATVCALRCPPSTDAAQLFATLFSPNFINPHTVL